MSLFMTFPCAAGRRIGMSRLPAITGKKLIATLRKLGFENIRTVGSHHYLKHADGRATVVPAHSGENIGKGLLSKILRDTEVSREELLRHL